ncbi:DUF4292 domain-containing protein [Marinigracilibium pacificum]|uniref:DUF4292 domain-containing protein n=1 Tax=Marinigracilibium pacificum TaxID=2729599 RepID=A0A848IVY0_9BACT|nr:DUF4292 domain-containing protein [Marinigracilibium pacificum]NMM48653.1 DUF4292 domain-containing protein [Marinigracilibium pacificum]
MKIKFVAIILMAFLILTSCNKKFSTLNFSFGNKKKLKVENLDFNYLKAKGKIKLETDANETNATVNIRIKKDSIIWMSLGSAIGIEGGRVLINRDSMIMINRLDKNYKVFTFEELSEKYKFDVNYDILQSLLLGEMPIEDLDDAEIERSGNFYKVTQNYRDKEVVNMVNSVTLKLENITMTDSPVPNKLNVTYRNFDYPKGKTVPVAFTSMIYLEYYEDNAKFMAQIGLEYNKVELEDKPVSFPFSLPDKYTRVE